MDDIETLLETLLVIIAGKDTIIAELQGRQQMAAVIQADTDKAITDLRAELREWHAHDCRKVARGFDGAAAMVTPPWEPRGIKVGEIFGCDIFVEDE
jgi:hypothetical protein